MWRGSLRHRRRRAISLIQISRGRDFARGLIAHEGALGASLPNRTASPADMAFERVDRPGIQQMMLAIHHFQGDPLGVAAHDLRRDQAIAEFFAPVRLPLLRLPDRLHPADYVAGNEILAAWYPRRHPQFVGGAPAAVNCLVDPGPGRCFANSLIR